MDNVLAGKLIDRISNFTDYNVNIMDENGILVASRMKERIGSFHEVAFDIINGTEDIVMVDMDNPENGVKAGVNMAIYTNKNKVGVVGVTGSPDTVLAVAKIIKMSVEVMMEYEMYKYESLKKYNLREQLMHLIFYNDNYEREDLSKYFKALNLDEEILRIPVLIQMENSSAHMKKVKEIMDGNIFLSRQDIGDITKRDLYSFRIDYDIKDVMQDYKYLIGECLSLFSNISDRVIWFIMYMSVPYKMILYNIVRHIWTVCGCRKIWETVRTEVFYFMII
ncbi:MAG: sugar diacid recognition domain-containing protein [Eisenbergiella sp.]